MWTNTNKLLSKGFIGIKTGVTHAAGPCLATYLKGKKRSYIVVLLNCKSVDQRWIDTLKIIEHCQLKIKNGMGEDIKCKPNDKIDLNSEDNNEEFEIEKDEISLSYNQNQIV